jgi:PAT family acetyl-CoA transporter-like MFS transporter 1
MLKHFQANDSSNPHVELLALVNLPFSFKLFTAPMIDTFYFKNFGKRKSYIVPLHFIIAGAFFFLSFFINVTRQYILK